MAHAKSDNQETVPTQSNIQHQTAFSVSRKPRIPICPIVVCEHVAPSPLSCAGPVACPETEKKRKSLMQSSKSYTMHRIFVKTHKNFCRSFIIMK